MNEAFEARVVGNFHANNPGHCTVAESLQLVRETHNMHDPNAIVVINKSSGERVGHIRRDQAAVLVNAEVNIQEIICTLPI